MANRMYDKGRQGFLEGQIGFLTDTFRVMFVGAGYVPNTATDQYLASIPVPQRVATSAPLASKTATNGVADAADALFFAVIGPPVEYMVLYKDTGLDATSPLIALWDTVSGMPFVPNGSNVLVEWDNNPAVGIFKL